MKLLYMPSIVGLLLFVFSGPLVGGQHGQNTVVWISVDGFRHDYLERSETPTLDAMSSTGLFTKSLVPVFPSLTFPNHVSQVTGVPISKHGITANVFYDKKRQRTYWYPPWENLLESEAIWRTATRQGVRTVVMDWPLGHEQRGPDAAAYSQPRFDVKLTDRERLERLLELWESDNKETPLRLLIGWIGAVDTVGHRYGPESEEVRKAVEETDSLLAWFIPQAKELWNRTAKEGDELYFLISTDHGMSSVHTLVQPSLLAGVPKENDQAVVLNSGNVANIYLEDTPDREALIVGILESARAYDYVKVYRREELPEAWHYAHPNRTGDVVMVLDKGYVFSTKPETVSLAVEDWMEFKGVHGYDPSFDKDMLGYTLIYRWPTPLDGCEVEQISALQLHPTVAKILGIEPSVNALAEPVTW